MAIKGPLVAAGLAAALLAAGIAGQVLPDAPDPGEKPVLGLLTTLPIYWPESDGIDEALNGGGEAHWARTALERDNRLVTLDTLDGQDLSSIDRLVMAQPRPLAPGENVALDDWVRAGGKLLLFADPMLTEHSRFAIGDRRRPQDVVVLSPILKRWGLELQFDEDQPDGVRIASVDGLEIPVEWAGALVRVEPGAPSQCALSTAGLMAECRVGKGAVTVIADAAVLDRESGRQTGPVALLGLVSRALD
ncbi:MAG: ABC transporter [Tsuneonella sp.]